MAFMDENIMAIMQVCFYIVSFVITFSYLAYKMILIIIKKIKGENTEKDEAEIKEEISSALTKVYEKQCKKNNIAVDSEKAKKTITATTAVLISDVQSTGKGEVE